VGVSAQVAEDLLGAGERRFGVDHPGFGEQGAAQLIEAIGLGELVTKPDRSLAVEACEAMEKLSSEQSGKGRDRKQKLPRGACPALRIRVQAAAGNDAMQMGMVAQVSVCPGVQYGGETDESAESVGVPAKLEQGAGGGLKEQVVDPAGISPGQAVQFARQGEDHMEVVGRQDTLFALLEPPGLVQGLAFGAMSIAARVVGLRDPSAIGTDLLMAAQDRGPAVLDGPDHFPLLGGQDMGLAVCFCVRPKDIGDLMTGPRSGVARRTARVRPHRGLPEQGGLLGAEQIQGALGPSNMAGAHLRIAARRLDGAVPQEYLDDPDIGARLEQVGGKGMAQYVWGDPFGQAGLLDGLAEHLSYRIRGQGRVFTPPWEQIGAPGTFVPLIGP
jgi:hypothetical protein